MNNVDNVTELPRTSSFFRDIVKGVAIGAVVGFGTLFAMGHPSFDGLKDTLKGHVNTYVETLLVNEILVDSLTNIQRDSPSLVSEASVSMPVSSAPLSGSSLETQLMLMDMTVEVNKHALMVRKYEMIKAVSDATGASVGEVLLQELSARDAPSRQPVGIAQLPGLASPAGL